MRSFYAFCFSMVMGALVQAAGATFADSFSTEPTAWRAQNPGAAHWDSASQNLAVTWDSRQTNSFFYYKLPFALNRNDAFSFELTLRLDDVQVGIDPTKASTFELAFGFLDLTQALRTNYFRGSGISTTYGARGLVEFDYFPDSGFGATVGPVIVSTNNQFAYSHTFPVDLTPGETFRVGCAFDPAAQRLNVTLVHNGESIAIAPVDYSSATKDFRVDAFSITSYSDAGQNPPQSAGSLLAHGAIDDVVVSWTDPIGTIAVRRQDPFWAVSFASRKGWIYTLERSLDFAVWEQITSDFGNNGPLELNDADAPPGKTFYRVNASRP